MMFDHLPTSVAYNPVSSQISIRQAIRWKTFY